MKKNIRLVLLAVMLVLMVALTMVIASAATIDVAAGDNLAAAINGAAAGDTINITGKVTPTATIIIDKDLTLQGTGTVESTADVLIEVKGTAHLTVLSGNYWGPKTIFKISESATATFEDCYCDSSTLADAANEGANASACIAVYTNSTKDGAVTINGGKYIVAGGAKAASVCVSVYTPADINITGGVFSFMYGYNTSATSTQSNSNGKTYCSCISFSAAATVDISGGSFQGGDSSATTGVFTFLVPGVTINISDGEFYTYWMTSYRDTTDGSVNNWWTIHITGGTFKQNAGQANSGFFYYFTKGSSLIIDDGKFLAKTSNTQPMINNTVSVKSADGTHTGVGVQINGGTFTFTGNVANSIMFNVSDSNAKFEINGGSFTNAGSGKMFNIQNGTVSVNGGTFTNNTVADTITIVAGKVNGAVTIKNASFGGTGIGNWLTINSSRTVIIDNVTVDCIGHGIYVNPASGVAPTVTVTNTNITSAEGRACKDANGYVNVDDNSVFVSNGPDEDAPIFSVNGTLYKWDDAVNAVADGGTIVVTGNAKWTLVYGANKTITITCTGDGVIGGLLLNAGHVTFENVKMEVSRGDAIVVSVAGTSLTIKSGTYTSDGASCIAITSQNAQVVIEGGSFEQTSASHLITLNPADLVADQTVADATKIPLLIKGGSFKSAAKTGSQAIVDVTGLARADILGGTFEGGNAWFGLSSQGLLNLGDAEDPDALECKDAATRAIWLKNSSKEGGVLTINGGVYSLSKDCSATIYLNAAGADVVINGGTFNGRIPIISMHDGDYISHVTINGGTFIGEYTATIINFSGSNSDLYENNDGSLIINGGHFIAQNKGDIITFKADKPEAKVEINGGTFEAAESRIIYCGSCLANVTITGGTYIAGGARVFYFDSSSNIFHIDGGTFILEDSSTGGYSDECLIFCSGQAIATIQITGGTFVNQRRNSKQLIRNQNEKCNLYLAGGSYYMTNKDGFFNNDLNDSNNSVPVNQNNKGTYEGTEYYSFIIREGADLAPIPLLLPTMRVNMEAQGMRFTSLVPKAVSDALVAAGVSNVSYGTLIVPAEYLKDLEVTDGDYRAALTALAASKGVDASTIFVDVPAVNGIYKDEKTGIITFHASLINIKEENWNRAMVGISYVKADDTYYYSAANVDGAITFSKVAENAYNDVKEAWQKLGTKTYAYRSIIDNKSFSRFKPSVQESFKKYFTPAQ